MRRVNKPLQPKSDKRQSGSHLTLSRPDRPDFVFAFHDDEELGPGIACPKMLPPVKRGIERPRRAVCKT
jgi:hypothetical protein